MKQAREGAMVQDPASGLVAVTYNVHSSIGRDRACRPDRIVAVLREIGADIIALQEVAHCAGAGDAGDQFELFRDTLGMHGVPGLNLLYGRRRFGNVLLSRWPLHSIRRLDLSVHGREPRGAIDAEIAVGGERMRVIVTHLGLGRGERRRQVERLAGALEDGRDHPTLVMGDFNIFGGERRLLRQLGAPVARRHCPASFPARMPLLGLDRIWARPGAMIQDLRAHRSPLAAIASDHLPVVARLAFHFRHPAPLPEPAATDTDTDTEIVPRRATG